MAVSHGVWVNWYRLTLAGLFCLACAILAGCGGDGGARLVPVSGTVAAAGKPLTKGSVTYHPEATKGESAGVLPAATIDEQGQYSLSTQGRSGAPVGKYKVVVAVQVPSDPKDPYSIPKSLVDPVYSKPETTPLVVEVKDGAPAGAYDLKLTK